MKSNILLSALFFLCVVRTMGQNTIQLMQQDTSFSPLIGTTSGTTTFNVIFSLTLNNKGATLADLEIGVKWFEGRTDGNLKPVLKAETIKILKSEWPAPNTTAVVQKMVSLTTNAVKSLPNDIVGFLSLDNGGGDTNNKVVSDNNSNMKVVFTRTALYDSTKSFWMEVGANFDLIDGLQPNNFFTGVFFYKKDIRNLRKMDKDPSGKNLGVFAGVYESKSITSSSLADSNYFQYNDKSAFRLGRHDSLPVFRDSGNLATTTVVRNVSLFFSPQLRLTNGVAAADGFHVFLSLWLELQWQRVTTEYDYSKLKRIDTVFVPSANLSTYYSKTTKMESDFRSHYFGIGLPIFFKEKNTNLYFSPTFGVTNQPNYSKNAIGSLIYNQKWNPFFIFQFRLNEEKYGFAFTGEVRGLIKKDSAPIVSLALTKKFDITKFLEFK